MVWLVGAGPGDPDLLTLAAARVLQAADVVVHDALVGDGVLAMIPASAETIDVGKRPGAPVDQAAINALLVEHGSAGRSVVRLKGGDPYVFGRGGEEAQALSAAGVSWRVVPGVSAAFAAPALAGVPVTHRGISGAVTVLTGHRQPDGSAVNWNALAQVGGTLVILMGVAHRGEIAGALMAGGLVAETPVCIIEQASTPEERVRRCALAELGDTAVAAPATLVIGPVAGLDLGYGGS
jgi:uroporphyrin-III C-methyltransferase